MFVGITLESLEDHTTLRILKSWKANLPGKLLLIGKIGFDGASRQIMYKQKLENPESEDQSIFANAYVSLKLYLLNDEAQIIWENLHPLSLFCRVPN